MSSWTQCKLPGHVASGNQLFPLTWDKILLYKPRGEGTVY